MVVERRCNKYGEGGGDGVTVVRCEFGGGVDGTWDCREFSTAIGRIFIELGKLLKYMYKQLQIKCK